MNVPPWLVLLMATALPIAFAYQLVSRRYGWRVIAYWAFIFCLLVGGEAAAESLGWDITRVGNLRMLPDLSGGAIAVAVLWFLGI